MRAALAISLGVGLTGPAAAMAPPWILCQNLDGSVGDFIYAYPEDDPLLPGITSFTQRDPAGRETEQVLVACQSGRAVAYPHKNSAQADELLTRLSESNQRYNLRRVARQLNRAGITATFGTLDPEHCACKPETHGPSF